MLEWASRPSTLLLQLLFVRQIKDRIRTGEASLMLRNIYIYIYFYSVRFSEAFCTSPYVCVCMWVFVCAAVEETPSGCSYEPSVSVLVPQNVAELSQHVPAHTHAACDIRKH